MISYKDAGVDTDATDNIKKRMKKSLETGDPRVLSTMNTFASLVDGKFPGYTHPILVLKTEEPGSKQLLGVGKFYIYGKKNFLGVGGILSKNFYVFFF